MVKVVQVGTGRELVEDIIKRREAASSLRGASRVHRGIEGREQRATRRSAEAVSRW